MEEKLINAYTILIMAKRKTLNDVPENLRESVEIKIAERTIEVLSNEK
jgi:hypothetical protein